MKAGLIDWPSLAKSLAVHVVIILILLVGWEIGATPEKIREVPPHIKAVVVERPKPVQQKPEKAAPKKPVSKPKPKPKPKPEQKPKPKPKPKPEPKKPEPEKKLEVKKPPAPKGPSFEDLLAEESKDILKEEEKEKQRREEEEKQRLAEEQRQLEMDEQRRAEAERIASELDTYKALIQQTMRRYWKRPPVARENLVVKLKIRLLPGGELNDVSVSESSGNAAFDRSAVTAVMKAGRFSVPSDPVLFDRHFRSFTMIFNPNEI